MRHLWTVQTWRIPCYSSSRCTEWSAATRLALPRVWILDSIYIILEYFVCLFVCEFQELVEDLFQRWEEEGSGGVFVRFILRRKYRYERRKWIWTSEANCDVKSQLWYPYKIYARYLTSPQKNYPMLTSRELSTTWKWAKNTHAALCFLGTIFKCQAIRKSVLAFLPFSCPLLSSLSCSLVSSPLIGKSGSPTNCQK